VLWDMQCRVCPICGGGGDRDITLDHFDLKSDGGQYILGNVMAAHRDCNERRGNSPPSASHWEALSRLNTKLAEVFFAAPPQSP